MGILDDLVKGAAGAAATKGIGQSLGLEPQQGKLAEAVLGMLTSGGQGGLGGLAGLQRSMQAKGLGDVVGSWIGSMMTHSWVYDGEIDAGGNVLTLYADGPSFTDPATTAKYRDMIEFKSDDHRVLTASVLGDDGKWTTFMTAHYRRKK